MTATRMMQDQKGRFARVQNDGRTENLSVREPLALPLTPITDARMQRMAAMLDRNRPNGALTID